MKQVLLVALLCAAFSLSACGEQPETEYVPDILRIGVLPDESESVLNAKFSPLGQYLSSQVNRPYELVVPKDYAELVDRFEQGDFDLAYFGGLTFLQAQDRAAAVPLVMRDIDGHFSSYFIVSDDSQFRKLSEMKSMRLSFGSPLSTSGHLMPRFFLRENGIDPEAFFADVRFSGAHDRTAQWVVDGIVDVGAVNSVVVEEMLRDGRLGQQAVRILWETPPYADYVWAVRASMDEKFKHALADSFLSLSPVNPQHKSILTSLAAGGFLPASSEDFRSLRDVAVAQRLVGVREVRQ